MTFWKLLAVLLLVAANGFFVAAEFSLVAVRRTRIEELIAAGSRRAISTKKALDDLNLMLSGCQLGITFASLGLGAIGEPVLAHLFERAFESLPDGIRGFATHGVAVTIAFALITFLHVVIGELVPKNAAIAAPQTIALWLSTLMRVFTFTFRPIIWLFNATADAFLRMFKMNAGSELALLHTPEELAIIIEESRKGGAIKLGHSEILTRTLEFPEKRAVEAMIPRVAARALGADDGVDEMFQAVIDTGYSRFPVWKERPDEFTGVVHLKDMLKESRNNSKATVKDAMREAVIVHESLPLENVLIEMRRRRSHFAIVLDEFGSTAGILTIEDIIEELVGDIRDESDVRERDVRIIEGGMRVSGTLRPDELEEATGCKLPEGEYETVAGFIMQQLGRVAKRGDELPVEGFVVRVANVRRRRILSVDVLFDGGLAAGGREATS